METIYNKTERLGLGDAGPTAGQFGDEIMETRYRHESDM